MTYGVEAVIPLETGFPTLKTSSFSPSRKELGSYRRKKRKYNGPFGILPTQTQARL